MDSRTKTKVDFEAIAKAERFLNSVLGYQAAIAVHRLRDDLGLDVEELNLAVAPISSESVGVYRVVCTIVRVNASEPIVLEAVVEAHKALAMAKEMSTSNLPTSRRNGGTRRSEQEKI